MAKSRPWPSHQSTLCIYINDTGLNLFCSSQSPYISTTRYIYIYINPKPEYNKNHPYYFHNKCKTRMSCQVPETYTPALTRCNTKKGTGAGLRRHGPTALVRIMIIKWPAAPGKPVEGDRVLVSGSLRLPVTKALEKSQLEQHDGNLALSLSGSLFLSFGLFFTKTRQAMQNTGVFSIIIIKTTHIIFIINAKQGCPAKCERPTPALTRCNTKKGTVEFTGAHMSKLPSPALTRCNTKKGTGECTGTQNP